MALPTVTIAGRQVRVDIIDHPPAEALAALRDLLVEPDTLDRRCRAAILDSARTDRDGGARLYVSHHRDLANEALQSAIQDPETLDLETITAFVEAMSVRGIWATPDSSSAFLHVDYTIGEDGTQYVLTVLLDRHGKIRSVDMES